MRCRNSNRDGGGPSKAVLQGKALNRPKLLRSRVGVVSVREKASQRRQVRNSETSASEPPMKRRKKNRVTSKPGLILWPGRNPAGAC